MGRPRTPTNVLDMRGAFAKNPKRAKERENEPDAGGEVGEPPEHLTDVEKAVWLEVLELTAPGVVGKSDRLALEMLACMIAQIREAHWMVPAAVLTRCETLMGKFGMTPADRSKVGAPKKDKANPFAGLVRKGSKA